MGIDDTIHFLARFLISFTVLSAVFADLILLPALLLVFKPMKKLAAEGAGRGGA